MSEKPLVTTIERQQFQAASETVVEWTPAKIRETFGEEDDTSLVLALLEKCERLEAALQRCRKVFMGFECRDIVADIDASLEGEHGPSLKSLRGMASLPPGKTSEQIVEDSRGPVRFDEPRDREWILAMAEALGTRGGHEVPIVPEAEPFRRLFDSIRARQITVANAAIEKAAALEADIAPHRTRALKLTATMPRHLGKHFVQALCDEIERLRGGA